MVFGYADPPYPGQSKKHYADHPDYAGEVDHAHLIERLVGGYPDGWVLHTHVRGLREILPLVPDDAHVLAWCKPFCSWKRNVYPARTWEPVIVWGGRRAYGTRETPRDHFEAEEVIPDDTPPQYVAESITLRRGVAGAKPERVCWWLFDCLGAEEGDGLDDLFPGSGAVARAWESYWRQRPLPFPAAPVTEPMFGGAS
jgi:hypothetical protein